MGTTNNTYAYYTFLFPSLFRIQDNGFGSVTSSTKKEGKEGNKKHDTKVSKIKEGGSGDYSTKKE